MSETITAIYEKGMLRPLLPLSLPEHTQVQIQIITPAKDTKRRRVHQALLDAGIIQPHPPAQAVPLVSEEQLAVTACLLYTSPSPRD